MLMKSELVHTHPACPDHFREQQQQQHEMMRMRSTTKSRAEMPIMAAVLNPVKRRALSTVLLKRSTGVGSEFAA